MLETMLLIKLYKNYIVNSPIASSEPHKGYALSPNDARGRSRRREVEVHTYDSDKVLCVDENVEIYETRRGMPAFRSPKTGHRYGAGEYEGLVYEGLAEVRDLQDGDDPQEIGSLV